MRQARSKNHVEKIDSLFSGKYEPLYETPRGQAYLGVYDTEDRQAVYTVFEVLNSRGLDADWLDKCKSVLMGRAFETAKTEPARQAAIEELEKCWCNIYARLACFPVAGHEVLRATASIRCESEAGKPLSSEVSLATLKALCTSPKEAQEVAGWLHDTTDALVALEEQRHLGPVADVLQARVLAAALRLARQLSDEEKQICLDQWERVTFRIYGLLRKDSRSKVGDYIRLARKIMRCETGATSFAEVLPALKALGADAPIDKAIQDGLARQNCYEGFADECRYILWRYEEYLATKAGAEVNKELRATIWNARTAAETIEHVYPQNPEIPGPWDGKLKAGEVVGDHVHRIGNLLLLPKPLNSEAQRKGFSEKKVAYAKTEGLRTIAEVVSPSVSDWTQAEIEDREKRIVEWAKTAWADVP